MKKIFFLADNRLEIKEGERMKNKQIPSKKNRIRIVSRNGNVVNNSLNREEQNRLEKLLDTQIRQTILNVFKGPMLDFIGQIAPNKKKKFIELIEKEIEHNQTSTDGTKINNKKNPKSKKSSLKQIKNSDSN